MKKALLLGDEKARYHPLSGIKAPLTRALDGALALETGVDYATLTLDALRQYDVVINCAERWDERAPKAATAALVAYVVDGGSYMALHGGLVTPRTDELSLMVGAKFLGHPSQLLMDFRPGADRHPIIEWSQPFKVTEEPYRFEFDVFRRSHVLLEYRYSHAWYPAAWCHSFALGKVFCLVPGHSAETFIAPVRTLLYKAGLWLTDRM